MKISPAVTVLSPDNVEREVDLQLHAPLKSGAPERLEIGKAIAYAPFINAHDHLIGNWYPRSGDHRPYANSHIWVEDMRHSFSYEERNAFWINDGSFVLTEPKANILAQLGAYKNLFSGCPIVQDHAPVQPDVYYDNFPITVLRHFRQCHSITLGNWWGGNPAEIELKKTNGCMPFVIHLGEGTDEVTQEEFAMLRHRGLLQPNLLIIHGIALSREELAEVADVGASVCWCPTSNFYLIGKTLDIHACLDLGVNVTLGTDSTQSGSINMLDEIAQAHQKFPEIPVSELYRMCTVNAAKALFINKDKAVLHPRHCGDLLLLDELETDPWNNLLEVSCEHINLLLHNGCPLYGDEHWLEHFQLDMDAYTTFRVGKRNKFVIGNPQHLNDQIDAVLGYHKDFPFLPF